MSDYLWDRSGEPEPEIQHLEELLAPLRQGGGGSLKFPRRRNWIPLALAASVLVLAAGTWVALKGNRAAWQVSGNTEIKRLSRGQSLKTTATSSAKLALDAVGEVEIEPNSQVSVVAMGSEQRLDLNRGKIRAMIWAPPGHFFVNTPSTVAVDLGCAYTLEVDDAGASLVRVTAGWVAFENNGQQSLVPADAICRTRKGHAPGVPYYQDAPAALQTAIARGNVPEILASARPRDAITVWHLLRRVPAEQRGSVFDRLTQMTEVPGDVTRQGVVQGDAAMIDRAAQAFLPAWVGKSALP